MAVSSTRLCFVVKNFQLNLHPIFLLGMKAQFGTTWLKEKVFLWLIMVWSGLYHLRIVIVDIFLLVTCFPVQNFPMTEAYKSVIIKCQRIETI